MVRAVEKLEVKFLQDIPAFVYANMSDMVTSGIHLTPYYRTGLLDRQTDTQFIFAINNNQKINN